MGLTGCLELCGSFTRSLRHFSLHFICLGGGGTNATVYVQRSEDITQVPGMGLGLWKMPLPTEPPPRPYTVTFYSLQVNHHVSLFVYLFIFETSSHNVAQVGWILRTILPPKSQEQRHKQQYVPLFFSLQTREEQVYKKIICSTCKQLCVSTKSDQRYTDPFFTMKKKKKCQVWDLLTCTIMVYTPPAISTCYTQRVACQSNPCLR